VQHIKVALPDGTYRGRTFQQVVARGGKQTALGDRSTPVAGAAHALQSNCNRARRVDLADQIDGADVDAQFERRRRNQQANLAVLQLALGGSLSLRARLP
jgi:hypothetical protein